MRPVDKGITLTKFKKHQDAQQPLINKLGEYCSYCERWIASGIHVEHKKPQENYPENKFEWSNFLLSCLNCNSGKGYGQLNLEDYLWVDLDNTFCAFTYDSEGRVLPNTIYDVSVNIKIERTWKLLGLNKHPDIFTAGQEKPTDKDKRYIHRKQAWAKAENKKKSLSVLDTPERRNEMTQDACERGFFSVWMTVFANDTNMRQRLITAFKGTSKDCFDINTQPIHRTGGQL